MSDYFCNVRDFKVALCPFIFAMLGILRLHYVRLFLQC